ncbi:hypothetical protein Bbelb_230730 [Branchiostoma belcheri]|nr:hypothetical protein Bbelb_230730 [Branchiostoma belcheri]
MTREGLSPLSKECSAPAFREARSIGPYAGLQAGVCVCAVFGAALGGKATGETQAILHTSTGAPQLQSRCGISGVLGVLGTKTHICGVFAQWADHTDIGPGQD